jgi:hypothetical protein
MPKLEAQQHRSDEEGGDEINEAARSRRISATSDRPPMTMAELAKEMRSDGWKFQLIAPKEMDRRVRELSQGRFEAETVAEAGEGANSTSTSERSNSPFIQPDKLVPLIQDQGWKFRAATPNFFDRLQEAMLREVRGQR